MTTGTKKDIVKTIARILERWDALPAQGHYDVNIHQARVELEQFIDGYDVDPEDLTVQAREAADAPHTDIVGPNHDEDDLEHKNDAAEGVGATRDGK